MARKKIKLQWIENPYTRRISLKKRRESFLKKVHEITTLCGVLGCAIIFSPGEEQPMHWPPTLEGVKEVTDKFFAMSELQQVRKSTTMESYLGNKVSKMHDKAGKVDKKVKEDEMKEVVHQILVEGRRLESLSVAEAHGVCWFMAERRKAAERKIYLFNHNLLGHNVEAGAGRNGGDGERGDNERDKAVVVEGGDKGGFGGEWGGPIIQGDLVDQWLRETDQNLNQNGGINNMGNPYWEVGSSSNHGGNHVINNDAIGGGYDLMGQPSQLSIGGNDNMMINSCGGNNHNNNMMISQEIMSGANIENCMGLSQWTKDFVWNGDGNIMGGNDMPLSQYTTTAGENGMGTSQWDFGGSIGAGENGTGTPLWTTGGIGNGMGTRQWTNGGENVNIFGIPQWSFGGSSTGGLSNIGMLQRQDTNTNGVGNNGIGMLQPINGGGGNDTRFSHYLTAGAENAMASPWWTFGESSSGGINGIEIAQGHYTNGGNSLTGLLNGGGGNDMQFSHYTTDVGGENATESSWWTNIISGINFDIGMPQSQDTNGGDNDVGMTQSTTGGAENGIEIPNHTIGDGGNNGGGSYNMEVPTVDGNNIGAAT